MTAKGFIERLTSFARIVEAVAVSDEPWLWNSYAPLAVNRRQSQALETNSS
jgi:hypothetical protein